jgi:hypothetical protein
LILRGPLGDPIGAFRGPHWGPLRGPMGPLGLPWEYLMGLLRGLNGAHRKTSMGPLEGPHKREKVKQYLTSDLRGHEVGPSLVARRSIAGLNKDPWAGLPIDGFLTVNPSTSKLLKDKKNC